MSAEPLARTPSRRGLGPLWAMAMIFGLPFLAAVLFYLNPGWLPQSQANRGMLIDPPVAAATWRLQGVDDRPMTLAEAANTWIILLITGSDCGPRCVARLHELRQVRRAAGVDRARVERMLLFSTSPAADSVTRLKQDDPRLMLGVSQRDQLIDQPLEPGAVVLIDPLGDAMMYYPATASAKDLLKDLKRLLKVSKDWRVPRQ